MLFKCPSDRSSSLRPRLIVSRRESSSRAPLPHSSLHRHRREHTFSLAYPGMPIEAPSVQPTSSASSPPTAPRGWIDPFRHFSTGDLLPCSSRRQTLLRAAIRPVPSRAACVPFRVCRRELQAGAKGYASGSVPLPYWQRTSPTAVPTWDEGLSLRCNFSTPPQTPKGGR